MRLFGEHSQVSLSPQKVQRNNPTAASKVREYVLMMLSPYIRRIACRDGRSGRFLDGSNHSSMLFATHGSHQTRGTRALRTYDQTRGRRGASPDLLDADRDLGWRVIC
jgi:hypothetical protein